jgi:tRNA(fMet)-specific endonuclease VapC
VTRGFLLDTDIVIEVLRGRADDLRPAFVANSDRIAVSTVSVMELAFGSGRSADPAGSRAAVNEFLAFVTILDFDTEAAADAGELRSELASLGTPIGAYDVMIAGHARSRGLAVVTRNVREFQRVPGLLVETW